MLNSTCILYSILSSKVDVINDVEHPCDKFERTQLTASFRIYSRYTTHRHIIYLKNSQFFDNTAVTPK